jgi:hypothetical protein
MTIAPNSRKVKRVEEALRIAHVLADMGVPVFTCRLDDDGDPRFPRNRNWQNAPAGEQSHRAIDLWKPGMGLCALCGVVFDVLDPDSRSGGHISWKPFWESLGEDAPLVFGITATPSRGAHIWIATQGLPKGKAAKGIDFQAGNPEGHKGFVFIAPTERPSKHDKDNGSVRPYTWVMPIDPQSTPWTQEPSQSLVTALRKGSAIQPERDGRLSIRELEQKSLEAGGPGSDVKQRYWLMLLVQEYEIMGYSHERIRKIMRKFLRNITNHDPADPWYPARKPNPDYYINTLFHTEAQLAEYRELLEMKGVTPLSIDITFWDNRPVLKHIQQWAYARLCSPWAVLGECLAEAICHTPPSFQLPPIVGGEGTLNMLIAIVGKSGAGKNAASRTARAAFKWHSELGENNTIPRIPVGSGEGLAKSFGFNQRNKDTGHQELIRLHTSVIITIPEIDTFRAINERGGATISPELRKLFSGETLGFGYSDISRRVIIPEHTYRSCVIAGVQPGRGEAILGDIDGGFAQRWLWMPAYDPSFPEGEIPEPIVMEWHCPGLADSLARTDDGEYSMRVFEGAAIAARDARLAEVRGSTDDMTSHRIYTQIKVAAGLALLDGCDEVRESDWELAAFVMKISDRTRDSVAAHLRQKAHAANIAAGKAEGVRQEARESTARIQVNTKIAKNILSKLKDGEWTGYNELSKKMPQYRDQLRGVLYSLIEAGRIEHQKYEYRGRTGDQYRKVLTG